MNFNNLPEIKNVNIVRKDEIQDDGIVYDDFDSNDANKDEEISVTNLESLSDSIIELLKLLKTPEMLNMKISNYAQYSNKIYTKYREKMPQKIIDLLLEDEKNGNVHNLAELTVLLERVIKVKISENPKEEYIKQEKELSEHALNKYVYPKHGGKDNFLKAMEQHSKK